MKSENTTYSIDLDAIRSRWQQEGRRTGENDSARIEKMLNAVKQQRSNSIKDRLARRSLVLALIGIIILPLNAVSLYYNVKVPLGPCIAVAVFGLMVGSLCLVLRREIINMQIVFKTTVEALHDIARYETHRLYMRIFSIIAMLLVLFWLLYSFYDIDPDIFYAGVAGGMVGAVIGLAVEYRTKRDIDALKREISDTENYVED